MDNIIDFGVDIGHNCIFNHGAVGIKKEDDLTKEVGEMVINKIIEAGSSAVSLLPATAKSKVHSLQQRVEKANNLKVRYLVSIHFNSSLDQANGTEVFAMSTEGLRVARNVLEEIVHLGFKNRGVKNGAHLYMINKSNMPAILIECCFVNGVYDMQLYDKKKMSEAIVRGLLKSLDKYNYYQPPAAALSKEEIVKDLQTLLNMIGYKDQHDNILDVDGKPGKFTKFAFSRLNGNGVYKSSFTKVQDLIKSIQNKLNKLNITDDNNSPLEVDGVIGNHTKSAIVKLINL